MKIIRYKHRCNTPAAVEQALEEGFEGVEFDVFLEWSDGPVVWHPPSSLAPVPLMEMLVPLLTLATPFAFNVKSNGLAKYLAPFMFNRDSFAFDLPGEEIPEYEEAGVPFMLRSSEYDRQFGGRGMGTMLDSFKNSPEALTCESRIVGLIDGSLRGFEPTAYTDLQSWSTRADRLYVITKVR